MLKLENYKTKAKFNYENTQIMRIFKKQENFRMIYLQIDKEMKKKEDEEWQGTVHAQNVIFDQYENLALKRGCQIHDVVANRDPKDAKKYNLSKPKVALRDVKDTDCCCFEVVKLDKKTQALSYEKANYAKTLA